MIPITTQLLQDNINNLTLEHILKGAEGYADFAIEYIFKDKVICTDYDQKIVQFQDEKGNTITDIEMTILAPMFFDSIKDKSGELVFSTNKKNMDSILFQQVATLFTNHIDLKNGAEGIQSDFYNDFVNHVCLTLSD